MRRLDLIAARRAESEDDQRALDLAQYALVEPRRRQASLMSGEIVLHVPLDGAREPLRIGRHAGLARRRRARKLALDDGGADYFLRIERRQPPHQVLQLAHV